MTFSPKYQIFYSNLKLKIMLSLPTTVEKALSLQAMLKSMAQLIMTTTLQQEHWML